MNESVVIRRAVANDGPSFLALVRKLAEYEKLEPPSHAGEQRLLNDAFGPKPRIEVLIGEFAGHAVAYAIFFETYSSFLALPTLFLEDLFVLSEAREHSVGGAIMRWLAREALRRNCGRFEWQVLTWNQVAIDFYEHMGAQRMTDWYSYRLTGPALARLGAPTSPAP